MLRYFFQLLEQFTFYDVSSLFLFNIVVCTFEIVDRKNVKHIKIDYLTLEHVKGVFYGLCG